MPSEKVSCCIFGGANIDELYITTASVGMSDEERAKDPGAGKLYRVKVNAQGEADFVFPG